MSHKIRKSKNYFKFGVEYTFVETKARTRRYLPRIYEVADIFRKKLKPWKAHDDGGALEVPSQPMSSIKKHMAWTKRLFKEASNHGFIARRVDREADGSKTYHGTGGGHIHVEVPLVGKTANARRKHQLQYVRRMAELYLKHPFIGWFTNEFMDDWNATCLQHRISRSFSPSVFRETMMQGILNTGTSAEPYSLAQTFFGYGDHGMASHTHGLPTRLRSEGLFSTLEFRFFDAPRNLAQAREHIDLAKAMHNVGLGNIEMPTPELEWETLKYPKHGNSRWMRTAKDEKLLEREWSRFIKALGLDTKRYAKYYQNYLDRRDYGVLN